MKNHSGVKVGFTHRSLLADDHSLDYQARVVGPVIARDTHVLDQHYPHERIPEDYNKPQEIPILSVPSERESREAVYVMRLPPRVPSPIGFTQYSNDLSEKLLAQVEPFLDKLLANYFDKLAPCYPLTDEDYILMRIKNHNTPPKIFLLLLVSHALFYWDTSPALRTYTRPDQDVVWQISAMSNAMNVHGGDLATIGAICLGVAGRPYQSVIHNAGNVARAVAVGHMIGLNHDCMGWKTASDIEKSMRWKIWWAVLIQDRWFNFAQGVPNYITKSQCDVPLPTMSLLITQARSGSLDHIRASEVYIQLCRLTEILGDILPLIYQVRAGADEEMIASQISRSEMELDQWVEMQPSWLQIDDLCDRSSIPGLRNLQLSYLSVRMLLQRVAWHETTRYQRESEPVSSLLSRCQMAADDIVRFVMSLDKNDLMGFWLPYNAQHFTSAVTLLLRCALQTSDSHTQVHCMTSARTLVDCLQKYHDEDKWDLAELCLVQTRTVLKRIEDALPLKPAKSGTAPPIMESVVHDHNNYERNYMDNHLQEEIISGDIFDGLQEGATSLQDLFPELFPDWINDNSAAGENFFTFND
ncbi:hypothetical protein B0A52_06390 [Exophiala mesophila]|uniref:Xylanolytic transcriptional activator regulatory domain-containing protein n=1 Tax=Exophiala mesophila TaxID=212818 RepID=A0A438N1Z7_EXOME|nr:hypothetical protein B0A52_06390 [Exophiala mesophila]